MTCPACGEPWQPWPGSKLDRHARCVFTSAQKAEILAMHEAGTSQPELAEQLGVTRDIVRCALHHARAEREGRSRDARRWGNRARPAQGA